MTIAEIVALILSGIGALGGLISVLAKVTDKTPEKAPDADLFYATVEGNLSLDNPNQRKLDLRVAEVKREVREVVGVSRSSAVSMARNSPRISSMRVVRTALPSPSRSSLITSPSSRPRWH